MKKSVLISVFGGLLFLVACNGGQPDDATAGEEEPGMEQFAGDESFQAAHDEPIELNFQARGEMISFPTPDDRQGSAYAQNY